MADITQTPVDVQIKAADTTCQRLQVGVTVSQGNVLYLNSTTSRYVLAKADAEATKDASHIAMTPAAAADDFIYAAPLNGSKVDVGATLVVDTEYYLSSANAGGIIAEKTDLNTGDYEVRLGKATATDTLDTTPADPKVP